VIRGERSCWRQTGGIAGRGDVPTEADSYMRYSESSLHFGKALSSSAGLLFLNGEDEAQ
jgi:hypothetical protein